MINAGRLLVDLQRQVSALEQDLLDVLAADSQKTAVWHWRYSRAVGGKRTGLPFEAWRAQQVTQVAIGWVMACVFTRFCEDNGLLEDAMLAGPGERLVEARERQIQYFREFPLRSDVDYLQGATAQLEKYDSTREFVDRHNALHLLDPSPDAATALLAFWRRIEPASGALVHDFSDPKLSTRFLGDLYQDLSPQARKEYALLQTPDFVEEFILELTLTPAIEEFTLAHVRLIDPACGSGHFLLGAFSRLLARWQQDEPNVDVRFHIERVLNQIHGVDINPYAVAIARFRLLVAALNASKIPRLADAPSWRWRVAVGDSLRYGMRHGQDELDGIAAEVLVGQRGEGDFVYEYEDAKELLYILNGRYEVVVANPPYITVKDPTLNALYRELWKRSCAGQYALSVPFAERIFDLAVPGGFTGQITSNSFMKREFGRKLIEQFFPSVELTHIIDTSGAFIPNHGTPTLILAGRQRDPRVSSVMTTVRAVLGVRGEPFVPADPASGSVWTSIKRCLDDPSADSEYVSLIDLNRGRLGSHPWSLTGGGAIDLKETLDLAGSSILGSKIASTGFMAVTREDEAYFRPPNVLCRGVSLDETAHVGDGAAIRDWSLEPTDATFFPYRRDGGRAQLSQRVGRDLWPYRRHLEERRALSGTQSDRGLTWYEFSDWHSDRWSAPLRIAFAFVATHNQFVLDRGGSVFIRTAPVVTLREGAAEGDHLQLLGLLNSSTACFWLKQVSHNKGVGGIGGGIGDEDWEPRFEFTGTKLQEFPLPDGAPLERARLLHRLAQDLSQTTPAAVCAADVPTRDALAKARSDYDRIRGEMVAAQEELDWEVYRLYGVLDEDLTANPSDVPELRLGERAFEIVLARKMAAGEVETQWFARHRSTPITEIPKHWPPAYRAVVQRRIETIESHPLLHLIERPECKRRWASKPWQDMEADALRSWLLDRLEREELWLRPQPTLRTVAQVADEMLADADFVAVAQLYARDVDLADVVRDLVRDQHVPFLAAWRYTDAGLRVRAEWERTWDLQRREDAGEQVGQVPVPPKYKQADFRDVTFWRNRGKLDVHKERFISYPDASRDGTLLLGWAGFDHLQQAQALATYVAERREIDAWGADRLTPLLAGLAEVLPWVAQWHAEVDPEFGVRPSEAYRGFLDEQALTLGLTADDLTRWRPPAPTRGRRRKTTRGTP